MRLLINKHDPERYATFIEDWANKKNYEYRICEAFKEERYPSATEFDWLIVLGGSQHAWEEDIHPWLAKEKRFISDVIYKNKIVLGICFGAQLIAEAFGGEVFTNKYPEIGWHEILLNSSGKQSFLFQNIPEKFISFHWHHDHFTLPPDCTGLACSKPTSNQAFCCNYRPVVGLQFHPELNHATIKDACELYADELVAGRYADDKRAILAKTDMIPEQDWLMDQLLDNMIQEYGTI